MKKILLVILMLATILPLASCGEKSDVPEGMQLVRGGEEYGFYMYVPEEWAVSNHGKISAAYASSVDTTSVSYVELDAPEGTVSEFFNASLSEFPKAPVVVEENKAVTFGNADSAVMFVFDHEYKEHTFRTMQVFAKYKDRFGLLTFTSVNEKMTSPELTQYEYYAEKRKSIIDNFKYVEKRGEVSAPEYERDEDGYNLVSDKSVAKFSLYLPSEFTVTSSGGMVEAALADGSNITMARATTTGIPVDKYWELRRSELEALFGEVTLIGEPKSVAFGDANEAYAYEYSFRYNGETLHVYQVYSVTFFDGFVFTYTAKEANFASHLDIIQKISDKVKF